MSFWKTIGPIGSVYGTGLGSQDFSTEYSKALVNPWLSQFYANDPTKPMLAGSPAGHTVFVCCTVLRSMAVGAGFSSANNFPILSSCGIEKPATRDVGWRIAVVRDISGAYFTFEIQQGTGVGAAGVQNPVFPGSSRPPVPSIQNLRRGDSFVLAYTWDGANIRLWNSITGQVQVTPAPGFVEDTLYKTILAGADLDINGALPPVGSPPTFPFAVESNGIFGISAVYASTQQVLTQNLDILGMMNLIEFSVANGQKLKVIDKLDLTKWQIYDSREGFMEVNSWTDTRGEHRFVAENWVAAFGNLPYYPAPGFLSIPKTSVPAQPYIQHRFVKYI